MGTYIFIISQLIYFFFLVLLVNSIKKHLFSNEHSNLLHLNSEGIFIPDNTTYNELYIQKLNNIDKNNNIYTKNYEAISILPYSDKLVSKNGLYNLLKSKLDKISFNKFIPKTFDLHNYFDKKEFNNYIFNYFKKYNKPKIFYLKKNVENKNGIEIFNLKNKNSLMELYGYFYQNNYKIIQELVENPLLYNKRLVILRIYIFIYKYNNDLNYYRYNWGKYLYPINDYDIEDNKSLISKSVEKLNIDNPMDIDLKEELNITQNIDICLKLLKEASMEMYMDNNILKNKKLFQHFGLDFILTNNNCEIIPKLLEINKNPILTNYYIKNKKKEINKKKLMIKEMYSIVRDNIKEINFKKI